jgi:hypothetical protein
MADALEVEPAAGEISVLAKRARVCSTLRKFPSRVPRSVGVERIHIGAFDPVDAPVELGLARSAVPAVAGHTRVSPEQNDKPSNDGDDHNEPHERSKRRARTLSTPGVDGQPDREDRYGGQSHERFEGFEVKGHADHLTRAGNCDWRGKVTSTAPRSRFALDGQLKSGGRDGLAPGPPDQRAVTQ